MPGQVPGMFMEVRDQRTEHHFLGWERIWA